MASKLRPKVEWAGDAEITIWFRNNPELVELKSWKLDRDKRLFTVEYLPKEI
jgi:hypothetical protein